MSEVKPIVAGLDGSPSSKDAVTYAAHMAARRHAPLHLVAVYQWPHYQLDAIGMPIPDGVTADTMRDALEKVAHAEATRLRAEVPGLSELHARVIAGHPAQILIGQSGTAGATVLGCRGLGGFAELLLGSTSTQVAMHGHGAVVVVRGLSDPDGPVLVGYDGSPSANEALEFAASEAAQRKTSLTVVNVYDASIEHAEQMLAQAAVAVQKSHADLPLELRAVYGDPADQLANISAEMSLTVVGSRGHGGFASLLLGAVGGTLIHYAKSPVAIIHPRREQS